MKPNAHDQLRWNEGAIVATLGAANLIRHHDGRWELRGGSAAEPAAAREWSPLIQHAVTFPDAPLPATAPQPNASKEVHNRILIADDDALVRGSLAAVLESEGFAVDEAQNGIEAVTRAVAHTPDLVLLDLNMPTGMAGRLSASLNGLPLCCQSLSSPPAPINTGKPCNWAWMPSWRNH